MIAVLLLAVFTNAAQLAAGLMSGASVQQAFVLKGACVTDVIGTLSELDMVALEDASGAVLVGASDVKCPCLKPGDRVDLAGKLAASRTIHFYPIAHVTNVLARHEGPLPQPRPAQLADIAAGLLDWQFVEITGFVRDLAPSDTNPKWVHLALCDAGHQLHLAAPLHGLTLADFRPLLGTRVAVRGFCNPQDRSNKIYQGRVFHCRGLKSFRMLTPRSPNRYDVPSLDTLHYRAPGEIAVSGYHRVVGRVLAAGQDRAVLLRTPAAELVRLDLERTAVLPNPGTTIEAVGLPESNIFNIILRHAEWRSCPAISIPPEYPVAELRITENINERIILHGRDVWIEGLVSYLPREEPEIVVLDVQGTLLRLNTGLRPQGRADIVPGSRVRAIGLYLLEADLRAAAFLPRITNAQILLKADDGLILLASPQWWTASRLLTVIGALLVIMLALAAGLVILRRVAEKRGRALAAETLARAETDLKVLERTRLAVELHDTLAQNLTGIALELETARQFLESDHVKLKRHLDLAVQSLRSSRQELCNCLWDLRSCALEEREMDSAIRRTLLLQLKDVKFALRFNVPRTRLTDNTAHAILRIVRELTLNAVRHGHATAIRIAGCIEGDRLLFSVQDNGCGFDPAHCPGVAEGHFGLEGVRERIRPLQGVLEIESMPEKGTRVFVSIPIPHVET